MGCTTVNDSYAPEYMLPIAASISYICYAMIFYMYYVVEIPAFMRHPTEITIYKYWFEVAYVSQYFWLAYIPSQSFWLTENDDDCTSQGFWATLCFICQFSLFGGELWYFVLSRDMYSTITNPFLNPKRQTRKYTAFVLAGASLSSIVLMILGPHVYGLSSDPMIWIQDQKQGSINWYKIFLFYFWMGLIYSYSFYVLWYVYQRIRNGLELTLKARLSSIHRTMTYTFGYTLFWTIVFVLQFVDFTGVLNHNYKQEVIVRTISAFVLASRGIWSICILLAGNWYDVETYFCNRFRIPLGIAPVESSDDSESMSPHLNVVLRKELLYYTTQGIKTAVRQQQLDRENGTRSIGTFTALPQSTLAFYRRSGSSSQSSDAMDGLFTFSFNELSESRTRSAESGVKYLSGQIPSTDTSYEEFMRIEKTRSMPCEPTHAFNPLSSQIKPNSQGIRVEPKGRTMSDSVLDADSAALMAAANGSVAPVQLPLTASNLQPANSASFGSNTAVVDLEVGRSTGDRGNVSSSPNDSLYSPPPTDNLARSPPLLNQEPSVLSGMRSPQESRKSMTASRFGLGFLGSGGDDDAAKAASRAVQTVSPTLEPVTSEFVMNVGNARVSFSRRAQDSRTEQVQSLNTDAIPEGQLSAEELRRQLVRGAASKDKLRSDFAFRDFVPHIFYKIRQLSNISDAEYVDAFTETTRESFSEGRSGAFLYFSKNERFIVKTTSKAEFMKLMSILPDYVDYITKFPMSLITRYLSAHAIVMYNTTLYFVVMLNIFPGVELSEKFDLKGSWVDRNGNNVGLTRSQRKTQTNLQDKVSVPLFKDNDLQNRINLRFEAAVSISLQIREDVLFLRSCQLTDYSLLIGVRRRKFEVVDHAESPLGGADLEAPRDEHKEPTEDEANPFHRDVDGGMHAGIVEGPGTYYFGIIDILEHWTLRKRLERWIKIYFRCLDGDGISAMAPIPYADRFWRRAVRDVFEYVEQGLDEDINVTPKLVFEPDAEAVASPIGRYSSFQQKTTGPVNQGSLLHRAQQGNAPAKKIPFQVNPNPAGTKRDVEDGIAELPGIRSTLVKEDDNGIGGENQRNVAGSYRGSMITRNSQFQVRETDKRFSLVPFDRPTGVRTLSNASTGSSNGTIRPSIGYNSTFRRVTAPPTNSPVDGDNATQPSLQPPPSTSTTHISYPDSIGAPTTPNGTARLSHLSEESSSTHESF